MTYVMMKMQNRYWVYNRTLGKPVGRFTTRAKARRHIQLLKEGRVH